MLSAAQDEPHLPQKCSRQPKISLISRKNALGSPRLASSSTKMLSVAQDYPHLPQKCSRYPKISLIFHKNALGSPRLASSSTKMLSISQNSLNLPQTNPLCTQSQMLKKQKHPYSLAKSMENNYICTTKPFF
jgi:hypothetical protein